MIVEFRESMQWLDTAPPDEVKRMVEALYRVHRLIAAITDLDELLERITEESRLVADAEASSIMLFDAEAEELFFHVALGSSGNQEALKREVRLKLGQGIAGVTAQQRKSLIVDDAQQDPRFYREADSASQFQTRNLLAVPMLEKEHLIGVIEVLNKRQEASFTDLDMRVLEMFANLAASAIVNAQLIKEQLRIERLAAIGQAMTGLSHYIKNIITGLTGSVDLIEMGLARNNLDVLQRTLPVFKRSTRRIANFVQDMLSFSKPREPLRRSCTIETILREAHESLAEFYESRGIAFVLDTDKAQDTIYVDQEALYRCFLNLFANAADALQDCPEARIQVRAEQVDPENLLITVCDNGPGIDIAVKDQIFDPFFSTKGSRGTGLGLAVTRKIIREHGGSITVRNQESGGACFSVCLPKDGPVLKTGASLPG